MAYVYADMGAMPKFQQRIVELIPELERQVSCNDELIEQTLEKLRQGISRAEAAERSAATAAYRAEQQLAAAEDYTRRYNSNLEDGESPISTDSFYYDAVYDAQMNHTYARASLERAENTLQNFESYVKRYRQQQQDGMDSFKRLAAQSGKFFENYIKLLAEAKKCTVFSMGASDDGTDWNRTSNTPEEEKIIRSMVENGEIDIPRVDPSATEPKASTAHLPTAKMGKFTGVRGNSEFIPNSTEARQVMAQYGKQSVTYKNNHPDFSAFAIHPSPWGKLNTQVEISHMTGSRSNPKWELGRRPKGTGHDPNYDLGNFAQADNELLKVMQGMCKDKNITLTIQDVLDFKEQNKLVWHECSDGKTMQLIPIEIHDACRHSGGVSEMNYRMAWGSVTLPD